MPTEFYVYLLLGAATGGLINGLAGFGTSLFALGFWLQVLDPVQAVSMAVVLSVSSGIQGVWIVRHAVWSNRLRLARFLLPALVGIPIGVALLAIVEAKSLKLAIAAIMLVYGGFFTLRRALPQLDHPTRITDAFVGFLGGILGGATSLSGVLPTMWSAMRSWSKLETRALLQPFNVTVLSLTMVVFAFRDVYTWQIIKMLGITVPVAILSAQIGIAVFVRLTDNQFRRLLIAMMFLSGLIMMARELLV